MMALRPGRRSAFRRAEDEVRTRDLQLGKLTLYQLSYFRVCLTNDDISGLFSKIQVPNAQKIPAGLQIYVLILLNNKILSVYFSEEAISFARRYREANQLLFNGISHFVSISAFVSTVLLK